MMGRALIAIGVLLVIGGLLIQAGVPLGRLPGDIAIKRGNSSFYFPIVTCILVSVVLTILGAIFRR
jgi:hypothetical protein